MHPLDGPRLKLTEARDDIDELEAEFNGFLTDKDIHSVTIDGDLDTLEIVYKARVTRAPDDRWPIKISKIAHGLRSALNNLAWQLALVRTSTPRRTVDYPVFLRRGSTRARDRNTYWGWALGPKTGRVAGALRDISPKHRAMLERTQPYRRGNGVTKDPLWCLHTMNRIDRHQEIHLVIIAALGTRITPPARGGFFYAGGITMRAGIRFVNGAELMRVGNLGTASPMDMKPRVSLSVCFGERCPSEFANKPVIKLLRDTDARVAGILKMFEPEFGSS